mmetsp:Transcript_8303/g.21027  ORF Transcript_8303/g.21027 Transcript_8303/m.21027 type:complete len:299 (-) Transcript_8303:532-1428(-)
MNGGRAHAFSLAASSVTLSPPPHQTQLDLLHEGRAFRSPHARGWPHTRKVRQSHHVRLVDVAMHVSDLPIHALQDARQPLALVLDLDEVACGHVDGPTPLHGLHLDVVGFFRGRLLGWRLPRKFLQAAGRHALFLSHHEDVPHEFALERPRAWIRDGHRPVWPSKRAIIHVVEVNPNLNNAPLFHARRAPDHAASKTTTTAANSNWIGLHWPQRCQTTAVANELNALKGWGDHLRCGAETKVCSGVEAGRRSGRRSWRWRRGQRWPRPHDGCLQGLAMNNEERGLPLALAHVRSDQIP